ncbi:hypothetical protein GGS24DRAFT_515869 [Hypoxylon argillaceum]|nr:hypothetical protein GGS24DRAFT_515869 [Hypoxylon argillaceum]KAI1155305.1 hypothetical protein F4825DRAFT_447648 [Nemania diffusa]
MCIYHYYGYICGHQHSEGSPIPPTLCRRHVRRPDEPMCDPPVYDDRIREGILCQTCDEHFGAASELCAKYKAQWQGNDNPLPPAVIKELDEKRLYDVYQIWKDGIHKGPKHTEQLRIISTTVDFKTEGDRLTTLLANSRSDWERDIMALSQTGYMTEDDTKQAEVMRRTIERGCSTEIEKMVSAKRTLIKKLADIAIDRGFHGTVITEDAREA